MADYPNAPSNISGITNATAPAAAGVGGPAKITELAEEVTAIGSDAYSAKAEGGGFATLTAAFTALWAAIAGKASSSHNHDGDYSASGHDHSGTYDPAGSAASAQAAAVQRANHTGTQLASTVSDFNTAVRTNRLDQMATPTASVAMGSQKITGLATPTAATDAVTKAYADALGGGGGTLPDGPFVYAVDYGVRMNGSFAVGLQTTSGSSTISSPPAPGYYGADFRASDVGATIRLNTGTFDQAVVTRTIASVAGDGTSCTVSGGAIPFTSGLATAEWSHDTDAEITANTVALQACIDAADGRTILFPPGTAIFDGGFTLREGSRFKGAGVTVRIGAPPTASDESSVYTYLVLKRGVDQTLFYAGPGCHGIEFRDIQTWGTTNPGTVEYNTLIFGAGDGFNINTLFDNARMYGGQHVLQAHNTSVGMVRGGIFGNGRLGGVRLNSSPDWCFIGADVHMYTNWNHLGTPPGANGTCYEFDLWSGGQTVVGGFAEFGQFGFVINSSSNTIMGCRLSDARDSAIAVMATAQNNTITGNIICDLGAWGGFTTGAQAGIWCAGNYNTISSNAIRDAIGNMDYSVILDLTASNNKVILGAPAHPHLNLSSGAGNVFI